LTGHLTVVGLGPAGPDLVTAGTLAAIEATPHRYLRTTRHPAAPVVGGARSFDAVYDGAETLDAVYRAIADALLAAVAEHGHVLYAVPGSPVVAERTVELLIEAAGDPAQDLEVEVLPALSFVDLAWARLRIDPFAAGARLVDGQRFAVEAAGERGPLLVAQCDRRSVLSDIKLAVEDDAPERVVVLQRLGLPDERVVEVAWADLDREVDADHLTSLWIPDLAAPVAAELQRFNELVFTLRQECPWDREQTHASLGRHLIEETYETIEAIDGVDVEAGTGFEHLEEELGDLLFQVFFHATLAAEEGQFTLADVARGIHDKLRLRHPHVFGEVEVESAGDVMRNWEQIKKAEKGRDSVMDGIPSALPALLYAAKVQKRADNSGFAYPSLDAAFADVEAEVAEARAEPSAHEVGDILYAATGVAHHLNIDPESALRGAADRFQARFRLVERLADDEGIDLNAADPATLDRWWRAAKTELGA
jgi:tetrapyrrole methylase family protein/MazG family protein